MADCWDMNVPRIRYLSALTYSAISVYIYLECLETKYVWFSGQENAAVSQESMA